LQLGQGTQLAQSFCDTSFFLVRQETFIYQSHLAGTARETRCVTGWWWKSNSTTNKGCLNPCCLLFMKIILTILYFFVIIEQDKRGRMKKGLYLILLAAIILILACGGRPNPRKVVMEFVEAVYASDSTAILKYVDFDQVAKEKLKHLPEEEQIQNLDLMKKDLYRSLLKNGAVRAKWQSFRIIVAGEHVQGDSARVEVTFMHKETGITRYTQTILKWEENAWKIVSYQE